VPRLPVLIAAMLRSGALCVCPSQIQVVLDKEREMARQLAKQGDKKRALLCLQRKRYQEELLAKTDQQLSNLEQMVRGAPTSQAGRLQSGLTPGRGGPGCVLRGAR